MLKKEHNHDNTTTTYLLNNKDIILSVKGPWDEFADDNGGIKIYAKDVCGRSIWDFVVGDETRMWLETIFQLARLNLSIIERSYRCDSPDLKRFMRMRIFPEEGGNLRIEHKILAIKERSAPVNIQYSKNSNRKKLRQRCSFCGRLNQDGKQGNWVEPLPEHADMSSEIIVIYTVCEDCQDLFPFK